jgi:hypothetical protein
MEPGLLDKLIVADQELPPFIDPKGSLAFRGLSHSEPVEFTS